MADKHVGHLQIIGMLENVCEFLRMMEFCQLAWKRK